MSSKLSYFTSAFWVTGLGLIAGTVVGYIYDGGMNGALEAGFLCLVLGALEASLSFDNAVVNAAVLKKMTPVWRHRFMTWGMLIAVFGMRLVFPILVVSAVVKINPVAALDIAVFHPDEYARIMESAHVTLNGFGAGFLLLVALRYFIDPEKDDHWFAWIERPLAKAGRLAVADLLIGVMLIGLVSLGIHDRTTFLYSSGVGIGSFFLLHLFMRFLHLPGEHARSLEKTSAALFIYLEFLDASFSMDGVIGAFALTHNLFIIAIGLGIGAMFVRSLTIFLVERQTLSQFRFLEHGAFYAIGALAATMLMDLYFDVPDVIIGVIGVAIIGLSLLSSVRTGTKEAA